MMMSFVSLSALDERTSASDSGSSTLLASGTRADSVPPLWCEVRVICAGVAHDDVQHSGAANEPTDDDESSITGPRATADRVGFALSGVVERVGAGVRAFAVGNSVCALLPLRLCGACATHVLVPEQLLVPKLKRVSFALLAASLSAASTAYAAVHVQCAVRPGHSALIVNPCSVEALLVARLLAALHASVAVLVRDAAERALLLSALPAQVRYLTDLHDSISSGHRFDHIIELRPCRAPGEPHVESVRVVEALAAHGTWVVCHSKPRELTAALSPPMMRKSARLAFVFDHTWASAATTRGALAAALLDFQKRIVAQPDLLQLQQQQQPDSGSSNGDESETGTDDGALVVPPLASFGIRPLDVRCFDAAEADSAVRHARATMQLQAVAIRFAPDPQPPTSAVSLLD
jgi:NADPH:quinone reductase-like Zn-dependent oxidoreductase